MKIIFIGNVQFSLSILEELVKKKANVVGVCGGINKTIRSDQVNLIEFCNKNSIPVHQTEDINSVLTIKWIKDKSPDLIFCIGWSQILKERILEIPKIATIGYHPSLLPYNRGRHPIIWALTLGIKKTGSTFFMIDAGTDTGPIISQKTIRLAKNETAATLYSKITTVACEQIESILKTLDTKNFKSVDQNKMIGNNWRKRTKEDGIIDWRMSAKTIVRLVNALSSPYEGATFIHEGNTYRVLKAKISRKYRMNDEYGKILSCRGSFLLIRCGEDAIEIEIEGKINVEEGEYL